MALFSSSNPILKESAYDGTIFQGMTVDQPMTIKGTANKFGFLFLMMMGTTLLSWSQFYKGSNPLPLLIIGVFGGLILAVIMGFKPKWSPYLAPAYALFEGLLVGSISAYYDYAYSTKYPGLVMQAVFLTLIVAFVMFLIFRYRIIRVTEKFRAVILIATGCIALFYLAKWVVYLIAPGSTFGAFTNAATPLGIGFSIFVVCLAALNLLLNFDIIEKGVENKAPKYMEWYSAVGLLITLVWLYLEILRLLAKLRSR
jgi:uncharacterized YccA/Bax inhibitor family protein